MTDRYGTNAAILASITPSTYPEASKNGAKVRAITDKFVAAATILVADKIYLGKLPKGALPLGGSIRYSGASTGTLTVGYTGATAALGAATALTTTKTQQLYPSLTQANTPLIADVDVFATLAGFVLATGDMLMFKYNYALE